VRDSSCHSERSEESHYEPVLRFHHDQPLQDPIYGVTSNLQRRVFEHKQKLANGFTRRYNITKLVYYEVTNDVFSAIRREKQIKGWLRSKKIDLIKSVNPEWKDLSEVGLESLDPSLCSG